MRPQLSVLLHSARPRLKAEWLRRLSIEPASISLANPDMLVDLMAETLTQLESLACTQSTSRWLRLRKVHLAPLRSLYSCRLNLLLAYFSSGAEALDTVLIADANLTTEEKFMLCQGWHFLAQNEIEALCEGCCRVCAPALSFPLPEKQ